MIQKPRKGDLGEVKIQSISWGAWPWTPYAPLAIVLEINNHLSQICTCKLYG